MIGSSLLRLGRNRSAGTASQSLNEMMRGRTHAAVPSCIPAARGAADSGRFFSSSTANESAEVPESRVIDVTQKPFRVRSAEAAERATKEILAGFEAQSKRKAEKASVKLSAPSISAALKNCPLSSAGKNQEDPLTAALQKSQSARDLGDAFRKSSQSLSQSLSQQKPFAVPGSWGRWAARPAPRARHEGGLGSSQGGRRGFASTSAFKPPPAPWKRTGRSSFSAPLPLHGSCKGKVGTNSTTSATSTLTRAKVDKTAVSARDNNTVPPFSPSFVDDALRSFEHRFGARPPSLDGTMAPGETLGSAQRATIGDRVSDWKFRFNVAEAEKKKLTQKYSSAKVETEIRARKAASSRVSSRDRLPPQVHAGRDRAVVEGFFASPEETLGEPCAYLGSSAAAPAAPKVEEESEACPYLGWSIVSAKDKTGVAQRPPAHLPAVTPGFFEQGNTPGFCGDAGDASEVSRGDFFSGQHFFSSGKFFSGEHEVKGGQVMSSSNSGSSNAAANTAMSGRMQANRQFHEANFGGDVVARNRRAHAERFEGASKQTNRVSASVPPIPSGRAASPKLRASTPAAAVEKRVGVSGKTQRYDSMGYLMFRDIVSLHFFFF